MPTPAIDLGRALAQIKYGLSRQNLSYAPVCSVNLAVFQLIRVANAHCAVIINLGGKHLQTIHYDRKC